MATEEESDERDSVLITLFCAHNASFFQVNVQWVKPTKYAILVYYWFSVVLKVAMKIIRE